jgi:hypothetical protein
MWLSIKHWRDWAMRELWSTHRTGPQPQALHYGYEKAGLTLHDQPIPWNAEAVLVEAWVRLPTANSRRKSDFQLRVARRDPIQPDTILREDGDDLYHLSFRLSPLGQSTIAELSYRNRPLGQLALPVINREEFMARLRLQMPTLFVRLGDQSVACRTFVANQCRGLLASAMVTSPSSLAPLLDLGMEVEFRSERQGSIQRIPIRLVNSQLLGQEALITVVPRALPRRIGSWVATWLIGDRPLATQRIRAISQRHFERSLRVVDTRFVLRRKNGAVSVTRHVPPLEEIDRVGPCFLISSSEPGMAGICPVEVYTQIQGAPEPRLLVRQEALITDGPTMFAPGTVDAHDLCQVSAFEIRRKGRLLGTLSLCPVPAAAFTSEGGFKVCDDFSWSPAAEDELNDRLNRLLGAPGTGERL